MARSAAARSHNKSNQVDEQLVRYRSMRDFHVTGEPSGGRVRAVPKKAADKLPFVIQKHAASHLHYDFRLGWNGVLKSWAVAKGPSYFPGDKRLAVQVEDHPMEYGGFEGIIPKGQYGGGTVMLWDRGTWEPHVDVDEGLRNGSLKFAMHGEKMKGKWALAVAAQRKATPRDWARELRGAAKEKLPKFIDPQLATLAKSPPLGERWVHELKLDGYRIQIRIDGERQAVQLLTRNGLDWTHRMKTLAETALRLPVKSALLDGEVVVLTQDGTSSFAELQGSFQGDSAAKQTHFAFDLLHLDGRNLRNLPLLERKRILQQVLPGGSPEMIRMSEHIEGDGQEIFRKACELGSEGIVSKLADGKYLSGRGGSWLKSKCYREQELVIGGFTLPTNGIHGVGALLLGHYENGALVYAGRTGTGFTQKTHRAIRDRLENLRATNTPFAKLPQGAAKGAIWVKPDLVAQVSFTTWTTDHLVRQAAFKGLREDKPAKSVVREEPMGESRRPSAAASQTAKPKAQVAPRASTAQPLPVRLTHPDKILDESSGVTKEQLARYYWEMSQYMLPHIADRPLTLVRCVEGSGKPCFYQKHRNEMTRVFDSVEVLNRKTGVREPYITISTREAVVQLAQIGVLEVHPWGSRNESMEQPDRIVIDLDPDPAVEWRTVAESAKEARKRLTRLGLKSFVKKTGGKGLHVVAPIRPQHEWPQVKQFAHEFVLAMEADNPRLFLTKMSKAARAGKIFLDYLRNDRGATAVAPYSPRARAGLPVAMPLSWRELNADEPLRFHVSNIEQWRKRLGRDPWRDMLKVDQRLVLS